MDLTDQIIGAESGGNPNAANPNSSAVGLGQFIGPTWTSLIQQYRPDLAQGKTPQQILAMRSDPDLSRQMVAAYAQQNGAALAKAGLDQTPGNLYLAHFAGPGGATAILKADPNASVGQILGPQVVAANPFLKNMTAGQLAQWAAGKVGGVQNSYQGSAQTAPDQTAAAPQPQQQAAAQPSSGGFAGWLSGEQQPDAQSRRQNNPMPQAAPSPSAPSPLQLPQGTMASQLMRARLLASIFGNQTA